MKRRLLAAILSLCIVMGMMPAMALAADPEPTGKIIYVSAQGRDAADAGSKDDPFKSLSAAVTYAINNDTIVLLTDITASSCARIADKHLTITSAPGATYTISRDTNFAQIQDNARSTYNPAMIEVTTPNSTGASVTLKNIVLDDMGRHEGNYFLQAASNNTGSTGFSSQYNGSKEEYTASYQNTEIVQDAIVAAYGMGYGTAEITLGEGAVLKNYGGMSAVRVNGGATLTMESGSVIQDDSAKENWEPSAGYDTNSSKRKAKMDYGAAGAVWVQGSAQASDSDIDVTMEKGAKIENVIGRAVYVDKGTVNIGGTISGITSDSLMWEGEDGIVLHLRNDAKATLSGVATNCTGGNMVIVNKAVFTMAEDSLLGNSDSSGIKTNEDAPTGSAPYDETRNTVIVNGEITGIQNDKNPIQFKYGTLEIGATARIHDNTGYYGALYLQRDAIVHIKGKIYNNHTSGRGGGIGMAGHGLVKLYMYDGAEICNNTSPNGGGISLATCEFTMLGGTISNNISTGDGGGVQVRKGATFIMKGGEITNNNSAGVGGGIVYESTESAACADLENGTISGNTMQATVTGDADTGFKVENGTPNDVAVAANGVSKAAYYLALGENVSLSNSKIILKKYGFSIENPANGVKFGNAATACETTIKNAYEQQNLDNIVGSLWYQTAEESLPLTVYDLNYDHTKELFAAVIETQEDGTPVSDAKAQLFTVEPDEDGNCHLVLPGGNANGYAVVFLQEGDQNAQIVKITPADITIYTGGKGYTGAVTGTSSSTDSGLPEPGFFVTLPDELDAELKAKVGYSGAGPIDLSQYISFEAETDQGDPRSWTLERYDENGASTVTVDGKTMYVYRLVPASGQDPVRMQFTDSEDGHIIISDAFDVDMEMLYQKYDMSIYTNRVDTTTIRAKVDNKVPTTRHEYLIATASGELTVRGVVDDITTDIKTDTPSSAADITAVADADTKYLINGSNLEVNDPSGVKLLVDHVVEEGQTTLKDFVVENVDKITDDFQFEFRYLDLVDSANGNVWIRPDKPMTIY